VLADDSERAGLGLSGVNGDEVAVDEKGVELHHGANTTGLDLVQKRR
jgi:hypothetical protein